jgi:ribosomal protein S18 acetylase RimI-like enzyme
MAADIRPACASDVDALLAIENAVFEFDRLQRSSIRRLIGSPSASVLVAENDAVAVGYCIVLFRAGTPTARLYSIATVPGMTGQGVGRALIEAVENAVIARGRISLRLEVREDNNRAIAIYERAGYRPIGRKPDYYEDGMAALRMEKRLVGEEAGRYGRLAEKATFAADESFSRLTDLILRREAR